MFVLQFFQNGAEWLCILDQLADALIQELEGLLEFGLDFIRLYD